MGKRTLFLGAAIAFILVLAWPSLRSETASAFDLFFWLLAVLAVSGLALWPATGRDQHAELRLERRGWADRIEFGNDRSAAHNTAQPADAQQSRVPPEIPTH
jgi:hypothetical protein